MELLGVARKTVINYHQDGLIPRAVTRDGNDPLWDRKAFLAWVFPSVPEPLSKIPGTYGAQAGRGRYGILDEAPDGRVICHVCGKAYNLLTSHIRKQHGLSAKAYRDQYGILKSRRLSSRDTAKALDQVVADEAKRMRNRRKKGDGYRRARQGRELTDEEKALFHDGLTPRQWGDIALGLLEDETLTIKTIADATGVKYAAAATRVRNAAKRICFAPGCENLVYVDGLCRWHANRGYNVGRTQIWPPPVKNPRGRPLTDEEKALFPYRLTPREWGKVARKLLDEQPSITMKSLSDSCGVHYSTAVWRIHHYNDKRGRSQS